MPREYIRQQRKSRHLTQKELAFKLGITQAYISALEKGKSPLRRELFIKLATELDIDPVKYTSFLPKISAKITKYQTFLEQLRKDYRTLTFRDFIRKYELDS